MAYRRTHVGKILVPALAFLLLCGIVVAEFPELLSLADNTANDFTVRKNNTLALSVHLHFSGHIRIPDIVSKTLVLDFLFYRLSPFENAALAPSKLFILLCNLRT
jgi:hypothetical protein